MRPQTQLKRAVYIFGLRVEELGLLLFVSGISAFVFSILNSRSSGWTLTGAAFFVFITGQMYFMVKRCLILPELMAFICCVTWVVAAWLSYQYPPTFYIYRMSVPKSMYFSYAVPAAIALWLGAHLPLRMHRQMHLANPLVLGRKDRLALDLVILAGISMDFISDFFPSELRFLFYLLGQLRFVGALSFLFLKLKGWQWRVAGVYILLFVHSSSSGIFYEFILWTGYLVISLSYVYQWGFRFLLFLFITFMIITPLNIIKFEYRTEIARKDYNALQRTQLLGSMFLDYMKGDWKYPGAANEGDKLVRWNQGWIIARVMSTVPTLEPYAGGETISEGVQASLLPRVVRKNKAVAASKAVFSRFTNLPLSGDTSMGLGIAGEMYANFGRGKGILSIFICGLLVGLAFGRFARLAARNPIWWAWAPFVLLSVLVGEWNVVDILNYIVKSVVVMMVVIFIVPFFRRQLMPVRFGGRRVAAIPKN